MPPSFVSLVRQERARARSTTTEATEATEATKTTDAARPAPGVRRVDAKPFEEETARRGVPLVSAGLRTGPPTIQYADDVVTPAEEVALLDVAFADDDPSWIALRGRRVLKFSAPLPPVLAAIAARLPRRANHVLVNAYAPGEGIVAHTDGPAYPDGLAMAVSLGQDRLLLFSRRLRPEEVVGTGEPPVVSVLLRRRSLVVFADRAYADHLHGVDDLTRRREPPLPPEAAASSSDAECGCCTEVVGSAKTPCANLAEARAYQGEVLRVERRRVSLTFRWWEDSVASC